MAEMTKPIIREGEPGYRRCSVTIMDTTDPEISFDSTGASSWVRYYQERVLPVWRPEGDAVAFQKLFERIKCRIEDERVK